MPQQEFLGAVLFSPVRLLLPKASYTNGYRTQVSLPQGKFIPWRQLSKAITSATSERLFSHVKAEFMLACKTCPGLQLLSLTS